jgi:hypothetical protein
MSELTPLNPRHRFLAQEDSTPDLVIDLSDTESVATTNTEDSLEREVDQESEQDQFLEISSMNQRYFLGFNRSREYGETSEIADFSRE